MTSEVSAKPKAVEGEVATESTPAAELALQSAAANEPSAGYARPVMIHRAICGSFERFIAILTEHFGGKWPFWLSPRQVLLIPVMTSATDYVKEVHTILRSHEIHADVDLGANTLNKKVRTGQLLQYNFIFGMKPFLVLMQLR
jgi:threonyl-tRNA synthetase